MANKEFIEKKVKCGNFSVKIGSTDRNNPRVIYFEGKTYVSPTFNDETTSYINIMNKIERFARKSVLKCVTGSSVFQKDFIASFNSSAERMKKGKYSTLHFEYYLIQPKDDILSVKEFIKKYPKEYIEPFINLENELNDNCFNVINKKPKPTV